MRADHFCTVKQKCEDLVIVKNLCHVESNSLHDLLVLDVLSRMSKVLHNDDGEKNAPIRVRTCLFKFDK